MLSRKSKYSTDPVDNNKNMGWDKIRFIIVSMQNRFYFIFFVCIIVLFSI